MSQALGIALKKIADLTERVENLEKEIIVIEATFKKAIAEVYKDHHDARQSAVMYGPIR